MKTNQVITSLLVTAWVSANAEASNFAEQTTNADFGGASQLSWETAVGLPSKRADAHYYTAILVRTRNRLFGWPSHRVYELGGIMSAPCYRCGIGAEGRGTALETPIVGISEQFEIVSTQYFSLEAGLGGYIKKPTDSVGSVFTFGERIALRSNIDSFQVEVFYRHFSNGSFTSDNRGYDFVGLSFSSDF